jgi:predicted ribosome quality control (RQC) complex YloA/Tae2 family protein
MNMDGFLLKSLATDLARILVDQRIDKVHQPTSGHLTIHVGKRRLSINVAPHETYMVLDGPKLANPLSPPFFCLMLRKHLTNSRIVKVQMPDFERIVELTCSGRDELGESAEVTLIVELTGRHSNVLLVNEAGLIIDALRRVPLGDGVRPIFPGLKYERPPEQGKLSPVTLSAEALLTLSATASVRLPEFLSANVQGLSMLLAREISFLLAPDENTVAVAIETWEAISAFIRSLAQRAESGEITSLYLSGEGPKRHLHIVPLSHLGAHSVVAGVNDALSAALCSQESGRLEAQLGRKLGQIISAKTRKAQKLMKALQEDLSITDNKNDHKRFGELLYANLGTFRLEGDMAVVTDYYDENLASVLVPVDPNRSMAENARRYFRQYEKAVGKEKYALNRLEETQMYLSYLAGLQSAVAQADDIHSLREIEQEMDEQGLITNGRNRSVKKVDTKHRQSGQARPREFISPDGVRILVGRNNLQNERLVKGAKPDDLWFHVQKAPGSHCIVEARSPMPDTTIEFAATLAAYFSSARDSTLVPVDYTEKKHLRRPPGAKPGYVTYERHRTVVINMAQVILPDIQ